MRVEAFNVKLLFLYLWLFLGVFMKNTNFFSLCNLHILLIVLYTIYLPGCLHSTDSKQRSQPQFDANTVPVVILGGGIAGLTAAIYLTQANIPTIVIEGPKPGGALSQSHGVRNWPGEYDVPGTEIVSKIKNHAIICGAQILQARVLSVDIKNYPFTFEIEHFVEGKKTTINAASCLVAMGTEPNFLNIPGERGDNGYWGRGVSNCAICDGFFFKDKKVIVVGGGDSAVEEASYLADIAKEVFILVRKDSFRAKDIKARDNLTNKKNVTVLFNTSVKEIKGDGAKITDVILINNKNNTPSNLRIDGVFLAIGSQPNTSLFKNQLNLDSQGFIRLNEHQATSVDGVFAAGDIADHQFVQAITAAGDGCRAALQIKRYIETIKYQINKTIDNESLKTNSENTKEVIEINSEQSFKDLVITSNKLVIIDMFAPMCLPCKRMLPIIEKLAKEFVNEISFVKINVANKEIDIDRLATMIHGKSVYSVPTIIFVKNGKEIKRIEGSCDYETLKNTTESALTNSKNLAFAQ